MVVYLQQRQLVLHLCTHYGMVHFLQHHIRCRQQEEIRHPSPLTTHNSQQLPGTEVLSENPSLRQMHTLIYVVLSII